jgi:hypothetical protein
MSRLMELPFMRHSKKRAARVLAAAVLMAGLVPVAAQGQTARTWVSRLTG